MRKSLIICVIALAVVCGCGKREAPPAGAEDKSAKPPLIGVAVPTAGAEYEACCKAVEDAGGRTVLIPMLEEADKLAAFIEKLDGVLLPGGADIPPGMYGEAPHRTVDLIDRKRAQYLVRVAQLAMDGDPSVLGICLGCQVMNVARGGTLIQDSPSEVPDALVHRGGRARHEVSVVEKTRLAEILGTKVEVNSWHHQAVEKLGEGLIVTARSSDGVIEAIELADTSRAGERFAVGVQWHPEGILDQPEQRALFATFVEACCTARKRN